MDEIKDGVTLNLEIRTLTLGKCIEKLENLSKAVERLSEDKLLSGVSALAITAKIG